LGLAGLGSNFHILGLQSVLFYLLSYSLAACVSFGVIHLWEERLGLVNIQMDHIKGMAKASPWLALCLATAIFSFAGLPPTAGFMGKFFVFYHALVQGLTWQVLWAVVMSIVGLYVYLRMMVHMFMHEAHPSWAGVVASKYTAPRGSCSLLGGFALLLWCLGTIGPDKLLQCLHPMAESVSKAPAFSVKQEP
jgi:NADH:ubiquinone oxidoreductase subunit 2 (subunit N)